MSKLNETDLELLQTGQNIDLSSPKYAYLGGKFTENPNDNRKIVVQIWYPAAEHGDSIYPYIDYPDIRASYISERLGIPEFMIKHFSTV